MVETSFTLKLEGDLAEQHLVEGVAAGEALIGFSRSALIVGNYLSEGRVRHQVPYIQQARVLVSPPRAGSWEAFFQLAIENPVVSGLGISITGAALYDAVKVTIKRISGQEIDPETTVVQQLEDQRPGDMDALAEAIEPAVKSLHSPIGLGATVINIIGHGNNVVLNDTSKSYLSASNRLGEIQSKILSISSYNANTKNGRAFDQDLSRNISFKVPSEAAPRSSGEIAAALSRYANKQPDPYVNVVYDVVEAPDGRPKLYIVHDAWYISE